MTNPVRGEVPLKLKDRALTLVLDHEALMQAESAFGKPLPMLLAEARLGFQAPVRALLFGALRTHHPEITLAEASAIYLREGDAVAAALEAAELAGLADDPAPGNKVGGAKPAGGRKGANPPKRQRPGKNSGRNGAKSG